MKQINPYNFVKLEKAGPDRSGGHPGFLRFHEEGYSGVLVCSLEALSDFITLGEISAIDDKSGIEVYRFHRNSSNVPVIRGTTIKGMIRVVYEALTDSCLCFAAHTAKKDGSPIYVYEAPGPYTNSECRRIDALCPACRLFGGIIGENDTCMGRVAFSDGKLTEGDLEVKRRYLRILSNPKPQYSMTYGRDGKQNGPIAGRKFYYHQYGEAWHIPERTANIQSIAVEEYATKGVRFRFQVFFDSLRKEELEWLMAAMELRSGMGHKIGLGKAIGLGSCRITVEDAKSEIVDSTSRYRKYDRRKGVDLNNFRGTAIKIPPTLEEVLRLNKPSQEGRIGYPNIRKGYPSVPIDALGVFGGKSKTPGKAEVQSCSPPEPVKKKTWECATLTWSPGNKTLTAKLEEKTATATGDLIIPEGHREKLFSRRKRKHVVADVSVEALGNSYKIVEIDGAPIFKND